MTRSDYFRPVSGGLSGLCVEPDDNPLSVCPLYSLSCHSRTVDVVAPLEPKITTATKLVSSQMCMLESQDNQISNKNDLTALLRD